MCLALSLSAFCLGITARGAVDMNKKASLTVVYGFGDEYFEGIPVKIYRVGAFDPTGNFELCDSFVGYPLAVGTVKSQSEWQQIADTAASYVVSDSIAPTASATTNAAGKAEFTELELGLYLVTKYRVDIENGWVEFFNFMTVLPAVDTEDNWVYHSEVRPKYTFGEYTVEDIDYSVVKLWKDVGYEHERPQNVTVEIYRDNALVETVTLSAENDWSYKWTAPDDGASWTVIEKGTPEKYTVSLSVRDTAFYVINTYSDTSTETGDIAGNYMFVAMGAALIGIGFVFFGTRRRGAVEQ